MHINEIKQIIDEIKQIIKDTPFENKVYACGGFVRDSIMGVSEIDDLDIVVELPEGGINLSLLVCDKLESTDPVIYKTFGTATVTYKGLDIEFVNTRKEAYGGVTRKPLTYFGTVEEDVKRRDFTINSILLNISTGEMLDLNNGIKDIENKLITTTSNPEIIFDEDPLRMLRAIRFATKLKFNIDEKTYNGIKSQCYQLSRISKERIQDEFNKILLSSNCILGLELMNRTGLIKFIHEDFINMVGLEQSAEFHYDDVWGHTLDSVKNIDNTIEHKLAALFHDIGKVHTKSLDEDGNIHFYKHENKSYEIVMESLIRLKYSNNIIDKVSFSVLNHMKWKQELNNKTLRKYLFINGLEQFLFELDLSIADAKSHKHSSRFIDIINKHIEFVKNEKIISKKEYPINGHDIMNRYNIKGQKVGELLNKSYDLFYENKQITTDEIFNVLDKYLKEA